MVHQKQDEPLFQREFDVVSAGDDFAPAVDGGESFSPVEVVYSGSAVIDVRGGLCQP